MVFSLDMFHSHSSSYVNNPLKMRTVYSLTSLFCTQSKVFRFIYLKTVSKQLDTNTWQITHTLEEKVHLLGCSFTVPADVYTIAALVRVS